MRVFAFIAFALCWRAPFLPYTDLNADEALYRLIGAAWRHGQLPYAGLWDRKPAGLFLVHAALAFLPGDPALVAHLAAAVSVGLGAACLCGAGRLLFPRMGPVGELAGFAWIVFSVRTGGEGMNAELLFGPLNVAGLFLLLRHRSFAAGLLLGMAAQVKYNAALEWPAFAAAAILLGLPGWPRRALACIAGTLLPTLVLAAWYWHAGHWAEWYAANITANLPLLDADGPAFDPANLPYHLTRQGPLWAGMLLTIFVRQDSTIRRGLVAAALWLLCAVLAVVAMRRFADHMMLQLLPPLCLLSAYGGVQLLRWRPPAAIAVLLACLAWTGRDFARPFLAAWEVMEQRRATPHWGDPSATAAAALPPGEAWVFGLQILGIYAEAGRTPPTRFPFPEHLWAGYSPAGGELDAILAHPPRSIVIAENWAPATPIWPKVRAELAAAYCLDTAIAPFTSRGGGPIGPREPILIYRRVTPPPP